MISSTIDIIVQIRNIMLGNIIVYDSNNIAICMNQSDNGGGEMLLTPRLLRVIHRLYPDIDVL